MVHIFHFLPTSLVFEILYPFRGYLMPSPVTKVVWFQLDVRTLEFFPPAESSLVDSNFTRQPYARRDIPNMLANLAILAIFMQIMSPEISLTCWRIWRFWRFLCKLCHQRYPWHVSEFVSDEIVCKVAAAVGVQIAPENIEISHRLHRKKGIKPIIAKFPNHKDKAKLYKARIQLKNLTLSALFPNYSATGLAGQRIFINENLTSYRSDMMKLAIEKRKDGKILSTWSLDGKIFIKTSPSGRPRQMFSMEEIKNLWCFLFFLLLPLLLLCTLRPSCYCSTLLSLEKRKLIA